MKIIFIIVQFQICEEKFQPDSDRFFPRFIIWTEIYKFGIFCEC